MRATASTTLSVGAGSGDTAGEDAGRRRPFFRLHGRLWQRRMTAIDKQCAPAPRVASRVGRPRSRGNVRRRQFLTAVGARHVVATRPNRMQRRNRELCHVCVRCRNRI